MNHPELTTDATDCSEDKEWQLMLTLSQNIRANQEGHMKQQWATSYYVLLLYAAIIGLYQQIYFNSFWLFFLALFIFVSGCFILAELELRIKYNHNLSRAIYKKCKKIDKLVGDHFPDWDKEDEEKNFNSLVLVFHIVNAIGFALTLFIIFEP